VNHFSRKLRIATNIRKKDQDLQQRTQTEFWTSTITATVFFGGIQLITIDMLGQYIGVLFDEIKDRFEYIIDKNGISTIRSAMHRRCTTRCALPAYCAGRKRTPPYSLLYPVYLFI
jgi:hypothetical protein